MTERFWNDNPGLRAETDQLRAKAEEEGTRSNRQSWPLPVEPAPPVEIWSDDDDPIEPRGWLLGNTFCREFLSELIGDGGTGKTALRIAQYLACATGRMLLDEHVFQRCRVLIICLEDGRDELRRRLRAARLHYGISAAEVVGWLYLCIPRGIRLIDITEGGKTVLGELHRQLIEQIKLLNIDIVGIDPFVKCHGASENDNTAIDAVATTLATIAQQHKCAVDIVHHTRKGLGDPGNADLGRGAIALKDACRIVNTVTPMNENEAKLFGIDDRERKYLVRLDKGKANLTPRAPDARWLKLVSIGLNNPTDTYPRGDEVQTVELWTPPPLYGGITIALANAILDQIEAGMPDGSRYSDNNAAKQRAAWQVVIEHAPDKNEKQARAIINDWVENDVLISRTYRDPRDHKERSGLWVNANKRPGARS